MAGVNDPGYTMPHEILALDERGDARGDEFDGRFEQVRGVADEVVVRERGVAFLLERIEGEEDASVEARRGVVGEAEVDRDAVGGLEADAVDLARDAIGLGREDRLRLRAVGFDELHALACGDAVGLEKDVELALAALLVPRLL